MNIIGIINLKLHFKFNIKEFRKKNVDFEIEWKKWWVLNLIKKKFEIEWEKKEYLNVIWIKNIKILWVNCIKKTNFAFTSIPSYDNKSWVISKFPCWTAICKAFLWKNDKNFIENIDF